MLCAGLHFSCLRLLSAISPEASFWETRSSGVDHRPLRHRGCTVLFCPGCLGVSFAVQRKGTRGTAVFLNFAGSRSSLVSHPQLSSLPCWSPGCPSRATIRFRSLCSLQRMAGIPGPWGCAGQDMASQTSGTSLPCSFPTLGLVFIFPMLSSLASAPSPLSCAHSVSVLSFLRKKSPWEGQWFRFHLPVCAGLVPGGGAKIPGAFWPKKQNIKQKQYCNKFNKDFKNGPHFLKQNLKKRKRNPPDKGSLYLSHLPL